MRVRPLLLGAVFVAAALLPAGAAQADNGVTVKATVAGRDVASADANDPLDLQPSDETVVRVEVTNGGSSPVEVRSVRLDARVLGLAFFSYTTRVDLTVAPGATGTRTFALDLSDLDGQADGLMQGAVSLIAPDHSTVAATDATWDVKGKLLSVYGVFGLAVAAITALLLVTLGLRLVRRTLPDNRWQRATLFAIPGVGVGLVATFTLGVLRVLVPSVTTALALIAGGLVVGFVLGYLTPAPGDEADRNELDEQDVVAVAPPAPAPAVPEATPAAPVPAPVVPEPVEEPRTTVMPVAPQQSAPQTTAVPLPDAAPPATTAIPAQAPDDDVPPPP